MTCYLPVERMRRHLFHHYSATNGTKNEDTYGHPTAPTQLKSLLADQPAHILLWQHRLPGLRALLPKNEPTEQTIHTTENVSFPGNVKQVLSLGPKFAVEPKKARSELSGTVRQASRQADRTEAARISEGVDVLTKRVLERSYCCSKR